MILERFAQPRRVLNKEGDGMSDQEQEQDQGVKERLNDSVDKRERARYELVSCQLTACRRVGAHDHFQGTTAPKHLTRDRLTRSTGQAREDDDRVKLRWARSLG